MIMSEEKIVNLKDIADICQKEKKDGKKIVISQGVFDLIHPGHIQHLKAAKKYGDILIVSIIPDRYVKKGPGRPVFSENLRAESVASIADVDYVTINKWDSSAKLIEYFKPNIYVKGKEYSDSSEDFTSTFRNEEKAINKINGEIRFTDEIAFSSSSIINERFDVLSKEAKDYIKDIKNVFSFDDVLSVLNGLEDLKVLIIGDVILDEYIFCKAMGKPEKAAVVSTKYLYGETYAGGCLAVANHIAGFVDDVHLISTLGMDDKEDFIQKNLKNNVKTKFYKTKYAPTIVKTRYIEKFEKSKLFEVSHINDEFIDKDTEKSIVSYLKETIPKYDIVIITDFGHGLITQDIQNTITKTSKFTAVNAQTNSANIGFNPITKYKNIDYISIDERELRIPYSMKYGEIEPLITRVARDTKCDKINITLGPAGSIFYQDKKTYFAPTFSTNVVDSVGAGDAVLSITSLLACRETHPKLIPFIGNSVGTLAVKTIGNKESVELVDLLSFIKYVMK